MATRVIVLEKTGPTQYRYALWAVVPAARQTFYANAEATSAWKGATQTDVDDLRAGRVVEKVDVVTRAPGATLAQVQADLQAAWQAYQDEVTNGNPWVRYGTVWDGTTWTSGGVS